MLLQHLNEVALGELQQKVLATLRDSLVLLRICSLQVLLEPLHKLVFLQLCAWMLEGSPPTDTALPPPIKWYLRFLHKCFVKSRGEGSPNPCSQITSKDLQFLFWPFLSTSGDHESSTLMKISDSHGNGTPLHSNNAHVQQDEELQQENLTGETSWCLQYGVEFAKWRDKLCTHLCTDLKVPWHSFFFLWFFKKSKYTNRKIIANLCAHMLVIASMSCEYRYQWKLQ
jgi:hypothetical protein